MLLLCPVADSDSVAIYSVQNVKNLNPVKQLFASLGYVCKHSVQVEHFKQSSIEASGSPAHSLTSGSRLNACAFVPLF